MSRKIVQKIAGFLSLSAALMLAATQADAHARLVGAEPAKDASVAAPTMIVLHFSEALETSISSFELTDTNGNKVTVETASAPDDQSLAAMPTAPLAPGLYAISWSVVGSDTHAMKGTYSFTVE